jgi:HK97 family phage major capsid protein
MRTHIQRVVRAAVATPWAIMPEKLEAIAAVLERRSAMEELPREEILAITQAASARRSRTEAPAGVAVLQVFGAISQRMDALDEMSGGTSVERLSAVFEAALQDPNIGTIVLHVDSPGGSVYGIAELAAKIYTARGQKKVIAIADSLMASAAYWIGTAADEVILTPGGEVGSIGVFALHVEGSRWFEKEGITPTIIRAPQFKAEMNQFEPLTKEAQAAEQEKINEIYASFVEAVARHRGVTAEAVRGGFAQGRTALAAEALEEGMVDRVATFDELLSELGVSRSARAPLTAEARPGIAASAAVPAGNLFKRGTSLVDVVDAVSRVQIHRATEAPGDAAVATTDSPTSQPAPAARETAMENPTATPTGAAPTDPAVAAGADREVERKRTRDIMSLCQAHGLGLDRAQAYLDGGMAPEQVALDIRRTAQENLAAITTPPVDMSDRDLKRYSVRRAILGQLGRIEGTRVDDGFEREISAEIEKRLPKGYKPQGGIFVPTRFRASQIDPSQHGILGGGISPAALQMLAALDPAAAQRLAALNIGTATAGGNTVFTEGGELIDMLRPRMRLAALGATILSGLSSPLAFPRQTGASAWSWRSENPGADQADSDATIGQVLLDPKSGQATTGFTRQLLTEASIDLDAFVQNDLNQVAALGIDKAGIQGAGGSEPTGILNTTGVNVVAIGTDGGAPTFPHVVDLETQVATDDADIGAMAYLTTPGIRGKLKTTERFANSGQPIWDRNEVNGYRAEASTQVPSNLTKGIGTNLHAILFGVWTQLLVGYFGAYELLVDPYAKKKQALIEVTAFQMAGIAARNPESFAAIKDAKTA